MFPSFTRFTNSGAFVHRGRQIYLRNDLPMGTELIKTKFPSNDQVQLSKTSLCSAIDKTRPVYFIFDYECLANEFDLIQHSSTQNIIILQSVVLRIADKSRVSERKIKELIRDPNRHFFLYLNVFSKETYVKKPLEMPNHIHDLHAIAQVFQHYATSLNHAAQIYAVFRNQSDADYVKSLNKCEESKVITLEQYCNLRSDVPNLSEILSLSSSSSSENEENQLYQPHLNPKNVQFGIDKGIYFSSPIYFRKSHFQGTCTISVPTNVPFSQLTPGQQLLLSSYKSRISDLGSSSSVSCDIYCTGPQFLNRSTNGDIVAVRLLPPRFWKKSVSQFEIDDEEEEDAVDDPKSNIGKDFSIKTDAEVVQFASQPLKMNDNYFLLSENESLQNIEKLVQGLIPTGIVVSILERRWQPICGTIQVDRGTSRPTHSTQKIASNRRSAMFVPFNKSFPKIRIHTRFFESLVSCRIIVAFDDWPSHSRYPNGHYCRTLGEIGDQNVESMMILMEHDVPFGPFTPDVLNCLPAPDFQLPEEEIKRRWDLRKLKIVSVDPPGCTDIDDALHCISIGPNLLQIGVHIADVTYFMKPGTALDSEAQNRCTSVYLVEKRIDMIPPRLSTDLCSLHEGVDRFAFSVLWTIDTTDYSIKKIEYGKSVICSAGAFTYDKALSIIQDTKNTSQIAFSLRNLLQFSKILRQRRMEKGALTLASPQMKIKLDNESDLNPTDISAYNYTDTNRMVEEFMLLANIAVATRLVEKYPTFAILRRHPSPDPARFDHIQASLEAHNLPKLVLESSKSLQNSLEKKRIIGASVSTSVDDNLSKPFDDLLKIMVTRCMYPAEYFSAGTLALDQYQHYGLAAELYTHFTSPIRRYADVLVHRLLAASIGVGQVDTFFHDSNLVDRLIRNMNKRHRMAQYAGRASVNLYTKQLLIKRGTHIVDAFIVSLGTEHIQVYMPEYGIDGPVQVSDDSHKPMLSPDSTQLSFVGKNHYAFKIFDQVAVAISTAPKGVAARFGIDLILVTPKLPWIEKIEIKETIPPQAKRVRKSL